MWRVTACWQNSCGCQRHINSSAATCCGADDAFGVAKSQVQAFAACVGLPPNACQGLGCAKFQGYRTDTGEMTSWEGPMSDPMSQIAVHCESALCTSSVIPSEGGGQ